MNLLASDELQGRETGSEGIEQAAVFLEAQLEGLDTSVNRLEEAARFDAQLRSGNEEQEKQLLDKLS